MTRVLGVGVRYGRPAVELLARQVAEIKAGQPLAAVTVVVASNHAAVAARRALAAQPGGVANVTFLTLHRLAERLGASALAAVGRRPTSAPVIAAAVRGVLDDAPGVFAPVCHHPSTERALIASHLELAGAADAALDPVAAASPRASDVVRIHRAVRDRLAGAWYDENDLLVAAAESLQRQADGEVNPVIVHLLADISSAAATLLRLLRPVRVNVGLTGDPDADGPVVAAHARAGITVAAHSIEPAGATGIISASDPDDEVRAAVRLVVAGMHEGVNLGRVALVYAMDNPYARLLHEQLEAAGIPWNGMPVRALGELLIGRTLRALLALGDRGYRRPDVLGVLTGAPLLDSELPVPGRAWERLSREAGVVGGNDWDDRLANLAALRRLEAEAIDAEREGDRRADSKRRDADAAEALAAFVGRLRFDLGAGATAGSWMAMVEWVRGLIGTYIGNDGHQSSWPEEERVGGHRVDAALERLGGLDVLGGPAPSVDIFRRALESELESGVRRVGRLGEGVLVGPASVVAGLVLDRVVVLGMAEGVFPPRRLEDSLLSDSERAAAGGELQLRAHRIHDDLRNLLVAIASAEEAVLCHPRGDLRRAGERPASRWLVSQAARLSGSPAIRSNELAGHASQPWLDYVPSFAAGLARMRHAATDQDLRLRAIARMSRDHSALTTDAVLTGALGVVEARRSARFTRFDGNLVTVADEIGRLVHASASRLQTWAGCPHQYLVQYVLGVQPVEEPERLLMISALDRGSLIHEILDEFVGNAIAEGHSFDLWRPIDHGRLRNVAEGHFARYQADGRTGRDLFWRRDKVQILADLDRFLVEDSKRLAQGIRPLSTEQSFGSLPVELPSGHRLLVGGKVDRIDRRPDGSLAVIDYKTGSSTRYRGIDEEHPHGHGKMLQLYLYALAAEVAFPSGLPVCSFYWFTTQRGGFKEVGYPVTPELAAKVAGAIDGIVEGIAAGVFPAHPSEVSSRSGYVECWYCTPDGRSDADRRTEWERIRLDPALAGYVGLAEPEALQ